MTSMLRCVRLGLVLVLGTLPLPFPPASAGANQVAVQPVPGAPQETRPVPERSQPRDARGRSEPRGTASISGRVISVETGLPIRRVQVRVGGPDVRTPRGAITDADGRFTVSELAAGRYSLVFMKSGFATLQYGQKAPNQPGTPIDLADGQKMQNISIALIRGGVISGRVFDEYGEPVVDARVHIMQQRWSNGRRRLMNTARPGQTNDRGEFRIWGLPPGSFFVSAVPGDRQMFFLDGAAAADTPDSSGYAATYYPGTAIQDEAQRITLASGQEINGIDFTLVTTRTVRVAGTVLGSDGRPMARANVMLFPRGAEGGMGSAQGGNTDLNGAFAIPGVTPGEYVLNARPQMTSPADMETAELASMPLTVGADDVKNVMLVAQRGVKASGRVTFEPAPPLTGLEGLRVFLPPWDNDGVFMSGPAFGPVTPQRTFEVKNLSGKRRFSLMGTPPGWTLKAVRVGGNDVLDVGYDFGKEDVTDVEVVLTNRVTSLSGSVKRDGQSPAAEYVVLAFSTDESHWQQPGSRRIATARPDQHGTYRFTTLPPGSYYIVALETMPEEWGNPDLYEQLKAHAKLATLSEGENETLELTLGTGSI